MGFCKLTHVSLRFRANGERYELGFTGGELGELIHNPTYVHAHTEKIL